MKTIVVGVDGSPRAPLVLRQAVEVASAMGGTLTLVRAVTVPIEFPVEAISMAPDGLPALLMEAGRKELERLSAEVPKERLAGLVVDIGSPWQVLCDAAKRLKADLLVVGTHGYTLLDHVVGTNAARVVNHAPCTTLVVRATTTEEKKG